MIIWPPGVYKPMVQVETFWNDYNFWCIAEWLLPLTRIFQPTCDSLRLFCSSHRTSYTILTAKPEVIFSVLVWEPLSGVGAGAGTGDILSGRKWSDHGAAAWPVTSRSRGLFTNDVGIFWGLWHPLVLMSAYHQLLACPLVLQIDYVSPEPKTIIFRIQFISTRVIRICVTNGVQLSLVRPTKACFGWIPSNRWIFHHSSSFLMTLGPSSSAFVSFLSYRWLRCCTLP